MAKDFALQKTHSAMSIIEIQENNLKHFFRFENNSRDVN